MAMLLEDAKSCLPGKFSIEHLNRFVEEREHILDPFYAAFEERFRGSREQILSRLQPYIPLIRESGVVNPETPLLDIGCGRGEWLELLRSSGFSSQGIDLNRVFVEQCKEMGLDVQEGEALDSLKAFPDASLGAVSGFHIVEHLPLETLIALFDEALRVLIPGGIVIFETPNPENFMVGSCNFYFDPTHRNPIPAPTLQFIAESRGFTNVTIMKLNPSTALPVREEGEVAQRFNMYFYGPMEYALIARKAVS
jgi:O-antigen chain-terminating methyltransferase